MRSLARECVLKYLYAKFFNQDNEGLFAVFLKDEKLTDDDKIFAKNLLLNVENNLDKYNQTIKNFSIGYKENRLFLIDKISIFIGFAELDYNKETDIPVIVDEAVKLSKKYSTEKSPDFVNGILAQYAKEVRNG